MSIQQTEREEEAPELTNPEGIRFTFKISLSTGKIKPAVNRVWTSILTMILLNNNLKLLFFKI